ncbi:mitochondrial assembly of ribosomal large subunit protein 1 [Bombina bombina]|uniref:mitochondrial assembly of ribosomal large subunit protein 1 n=1 Tax=Bombina bombina TaxID=8345 RepID=UPI00235B0F57|nr:mitochondrial assembly of ribosomal large subunit protein 1 [Bombina bombina]
MWARVLYKLPASTSCIARRTVTYEHRFGLWSSGWGRQKDRVCAEHSRVPSITGARPITWSVKRIHCLPSGSSPVSSETQLKGPSAADDCTEEVTVENPLPSFSIDALVRLLQQENARDLCVIRVPQEVKYAEYFVVVSGSSSRHIQAMAQYTLKMYKFLRSENEQHARIEGRDTADWMCIDFGNIVVHFMLPETRELYELEKLWTLRSHDDQLSQMVPEILPDDFTFGLNER